MGRMVTISLNSSGSQLSDFKKVLGRVLDKLIVDNVFYEDEAITVAKWILGENAKRVYRL